MNSKVLYIGVNDHQIDLFEGQYIVPNGMAYNSYLILDEKVAVVDTVDAAFGEEWLENLKSNLEGREPDYLIVQHMEPDHSANIHIFAEAYPKAQIIATDRAFVMMNQFFGTDFVDRRRIVKDGEQLELGERKLGFYTAPMVHWPEVMMTFEEKEGILFSADGFGKFGALDIDEDWACEARRYYFGIVGKYGAQVQAILKKAGGLPIRKIYPLHGPILEENLGYYLDLYNTWSSYGVESDGIALFYTSVYGNTKKAVEQLADMLKEKGCAKVVVNDLARCDMAEAVEDAFRYGKIILATTTYNGDIFPFMRNFIHELKERGYQKRKIGLIENGSWAPTAARIMQKMLEGSKELSFCETVVTVRSAVNALNEAQLEALANEMMV